MSEHTRILASSVMDADWLEKLIGWKWAIIVILGCAMVVDCIAGLIVAWRKGTFDKEKALAGIFKKLSVALVILVVYLADIAFSIINEHLPEKMNWPGYLFPAVVLIYLCREFRSILQLAKVLGAKIPDWLSKLLNI